jgi:hypothetical protein
MGQTRRIRSPPTVGSRHRPDTSPAAAHRSNAPAAGSATSTTTASASSSPADNPSARLLKSRDSDPAVPGQSRRATQRRPVPIPDPRQRHRVRHRVRRDLHHKPDRRYSHSTRSATRQRHRRTLRPHRPNRTARPHADLDQRALQVGARPHLPPRPVSRTRGRRVRHHELHRVVQPPSTRPVHSTITEGPATRPRPHTRLRTTGTPGHPITRAVMRPGAASHPDRVNSLVLYPDIGR